MTQGQYIGTAKGISLQSLDKLLAKFRKWTYNKCFLRIVRLLSRRMMGAKLWKKNEKSKFLIKIIQKVLITKILQDSKQIQKASVLSSFGVYFGEIQKVDKNNTDAFFRQGSPYSIAKTKNVTLIYHKKTNLSIV